MEKALPTFRGQAGDVWHQLSRKLDAEFREREGWRQDKVVARVGAWTVTLDVHSEPGYKHETYYTRFRAPYINPDGFRFNLYHQSFWSGLASLLGAQDIKTGHPGIDGKFTIKASDEQKMKLLLANPELRRLLEAEPGAHLHVRDSAEWFATEFPQGVDELVLEVEGRVESLERLERLYTLFAETLHTLSHIGSAYEQDPKFPG